jgi:hypothetical protein
MKIISYKDDAVHSQYHEIEGRENISWVTHRTACLIQRNILIVDTVRIASPEHSRLVEEHNPV